MGVKITRWTARGLAILVILFGLPFYFGYGNPLPFARPEYTLYDNLWLSIFPLVFIGLSLGLRYEKLGGYLTAISILVGILGSALMGMGFGLHMLLPLAIGVLYLVLAYRAP